MNLRTDYQKLEHQRDKSQLLTVHQQWKLTDLSYLKPFYKQGHKSVRGSGAVGGASRTSTEHESDDDPDHEPEPNDRGHESSSSSRKETPRKIPVVNCPMAARRPKKRREERTQSDKEETSSKFERERERGRNEGVCKPPGGPLTNSSTGPSRTGEGKLLPMDVGIHKPNATSELA